MIDQNFNELSASKSQAYDEYGNPKMQILGNTLNVQQEAKKLFRSVDANKEVNNPFLTIEENKKSKQKEGSSNAYYNPFPNINKPIFLVAIISFISVFHKLFKSAV